MSDRSIVGIMRCAVAVKREEDREAPCKAGPTRQPRASFATNVNAIVIGEFGVNARHAVAFTRATRDRAHTFLRIVF